MQVKGELISVKTLIYSLYAINREYIEFELNGWRTYPSNSTFNLWTRKYVCNECAKFTGCLDYHYINEVRKTEVTHIKRLFYKFICYKCNKKLYKILKFTTEI